MRSFSRGVELASRVGAHGRLMNAARAMHTLARSPSCGLRADRRLGESGGAGCLAVAAGRVVEHLEKLRDGTVDESPTVAVNGGATRAPVDDEGDRLREERRARLVEAQPPRERDPPPPWFADRPGVAPEFCLRFVVTAARACAAAGMNHRAIDLAVGIAEALGTADAAAAAMPIAVAAARDVADSLPEGMLEGLEKSARAALGARPKPVAALADARALASIDAAEYARRGPATRTLRRATAEDLERNFSLFWNGINEPESTAAPFGAEITLPPWKTGLLETGTPSTWKPPVGSAPLSHGDAVEAAYVRAVATARTDNDAGVVAQALLELGDFKALAGHPTAAAFHWSACVDQITGCYRAVTTAGASAVPGDPEACLRRYGLWGCLRGAQAAARLASLGSIRRGSSVGSSSVGSVTLGNGHRIEAARISAALFAAPFTSTLAHSPRAVDIVSGRRTPPAQLWDGVDAHGSDPFRFDARSSCDFATDVGELLVASGRSLEALPPLAVAEHLAAHALRDARACARVRCAQAAALAGVGRFDAAGEKIDGVLAGDSLPSTSTGPDGRVIRDDAGAVVTRARGGESAPIASFDVSASVGAEANEAAIERIAAGEMPAAVADAYGDEVCAELSLVRARWLASLAAPLAVWRGDDADAVTGEPIAEPDGGSVDANVRDDVLARAEKILTELAESTFAAVAAAAAAEQERIDARRAKALEAREAREAARAEKEASEKTEREAAAAAEKEAREKAEREEEEAYELAGPYPVAVKKPPADSPDAAGAPGGGSDAENADPNAADGTGRDEKEPEDAGLTEGEPPLHTDVDVDVDEEDVVAKEVEEGETRRVISPWLCATPSQMSILARAKASLAEVLRARNRPKAAFDEATATARELEAIGDGRPEGVTPNGAAASKARDALRAVAHVRGSHALWLNLRAECALCLLELGHLDRCRDLASSCAAAADRLGATDHRRLFRYVAARAAATAGDVETAVASYDALLREMTTPQTPGGDGSPPPTPEFLATVAGTTAELLLRLGDASAAEASLEPATATTRAHARALGLAEALLYPDARSVHNPAVGYLVGLLLLRADAVRRSSPGRLAECATLLDEASSLCGSHTAATDARTHATIAMLRGHVLARMRARGQGGDERTIAEASLTKALAWATSPGAAHDRRLIRACLLELASLHVPAAEAEAAGIGGGPPAASPDDAKATARVVACLRHAAKAAKMRDAFEHESRIVADAASSTEWPAALIEAVAEEEAAREAAAGHAKLDDADVARARLAVASFVRLVGRLPAIGYFAPGARSARETAAATHSALASSCDAYKSRCCFAETPELPPGGDWDVDLTSGGGDGARAEGDASVPIARVVEDGGVHAQWIEPASEPPGWGRRAKTSSDGDARPVCLIFVVSSGDEAVAAVAGEASFDVREVRAMQREVRTMRKELADAGEAGVERARLDAFLRKFADFVEGPPPPDPKRARSRSQVPTRDTEDPAGGDVGDGDGDGDGAGDEAPPAMTTAEDVSLLSALEAFASPEGGYCGVNPALCAILHPALAKRRASRP